MISHLKDVLPCFAGVMLLGVGWILSPVTTFVVVASLLVASWTIVPFLKGRKS